jgi:S1-C subfamily serine protease
MSETRQKKTLSLRTLAGVGVTVLGTAAAVFVVAPVLFGQSATPQPRQRVQLRDFVDSNRGGLGASIRDVEASDVTREKLPSQTGAIIEDIRTAGAAAAAGMKAGDVVLQFDGEPVRSARQLTRMIDETPAGREVSVVVMRNGEKVTLKVTPRNASDFSDFFVDRNFGQDFGNQLRDRLRTELAPERFHVEMPALRHEFFAPNLEHFTVFSRATTRLGIVADELTPQLAEYFGVTSGVLVTTVEGAAKDAGLRAGDVVTKIGTTTIGNVTDLRRALTNVTGEVSVVVMRDKKEQTVKVTVK